MLQRIDLRLFKCFELLKLPLARLSLLSGPNASGKSSVLQALVLLHQTMSEQEWSTRLMLNGDSIRLGTVADVVDKVHGRGSFDLRIVDEEEDLSWIFEGERSDMSMAVKEVRANGQSQEEPTVLRYLQPPQDAAISRLTRSIRGLTYVTAERVGPREFYVLEDPQTAPVVGPAGEHAVSLLYLGRDERVIDGLVKSEAPPTRLRQVEHQMRLFFPGCGLELQPVPQANAVTLGLRTSDDTSFHRPVHVGFGLTQVFPIIVAGLSARPGDIVMIENPEVHLHPAGQARMGSFLADLAQADIQVVIETHSDHVLNGIRRSVKSGGLPAADVLLHFFVPRSGDASQVFSPTLDDTGNIDSWPDGFFDQFDKDMNYFAGWS